MVPGWRPEEMRITRVLVVLLMGLVSIHGLEDGEEKEILGVAVVCFFT